jgi:hypothetical protein
MLKNQTIELRRTFSKRPKGWDEDEGDGYCYSPYPKYEPKPEENKVDPKPPSNP